MITVHPPAIRKHFNKALLTTPCKLREDSETLWKAWQYIEKIWHKLDKCPGKKAKCEQLKQQFMGLYERSKVKEKEREAEKKHPTQIPLYFIGIIGRKGEKAFRRALYGRRIQPDSASRRYGKIYKIQAARNAISSEAMKEYGHNCKIGVKNDNIR